MKPGGINRFAQEYGIARGSVEKAVQVLRDEGLVRTVIGRGLRRACRIADE